MDIKEFKEKTTSLISKLPYWFTAKHTDEKGSKTKKFLNVYEESLKEFRDCIKFAYNMCDLEKFDNKDYKVLQIEIHKPKLVLVDGEIIQETKEFYFVKSCISGISKYYYDNSHGILYISNSDGKSINIDNMDFTGKLSEHLIWDANILDEYGLLLDLPRHKNENNKNYKKRLLSYSKLLGNSSIHKIAYFLGHSLGKVSEIEWLDGSTDIEITAGDIINSSVVVDDSPYFMCKKTGFNTLVLYGNEEYKGISRKITYMYSFDMYNLSDIENYDMYNNYFNSNNTPHKDLIGVYNKISKLCPIMWGMCRWGEMYWLEKNNQYIHINPTFDPDISVLKIK